MASITKKDLCAVSLPVILQRIYTSTVRLVYHDFATNLPLTCRYFTITLPLRFYFRLQEAVRHLPHEKTSDQHRVLSVSFFREL
jgi:hypothetical protein